MDGHCSHLPGCVTGADGKTCADSLETDSGRLFEIGTECDESEIPDGGCVMVKGVFSRNVDRIFFNVQ